MAVYAIGDIQGCFDDLQRLLDRIRFDPARDRLWSVGDLVNRGPKSLETVRFFKSLGDAAVVVLGNHDLHTIAVSEGIDPIKKKDTLGPLLAAPDAAELLGWLRQCPLLHHDEALGYTLVHAGLLPQWDLARASACAREVEMTLRGERYVEFLAHMYGNEPNQWSDELSGWDRLRVIVNAFTRLRYCDAQGRMDMRPKGAPGTQAAPLLPWFEVPGRKSAELRIVFGHWSTLGHCHNAKTLALDSGCVWGGALTAVRLDGLRPEALQLDCQGTLKPGTGK